ncbi:T9SS type A sorting domain-containing protein [Fibrella sp. WM1]|uniref:T9SS type A sorting domain-containing protein n=1 Tax=Fibrella musci TaxID=3242485 RepID=UPI00352099C4
MIQSGQFVDGCVGSPINLSFTTSGPFSATNTFRVQLSSDNGQTYVEQPASFTGSPAQITLPPPAIPNFYYYCRIVATDDLLRNRPSSHVLLRLKDKPHVVLTGSSADSIPINLYETAYLTMTFSGGGSYSLVMQDGTYLTDYAPTQVQVKPTKTTSYSVISVQNSCGVGTSEGRATVLVNEQQTKALLAKPVVLCDEATIPVYFATEGPLPADLTFEAQLYEGTGNPAIATLPISGTGSPLLLTVPASLMQKKAANYQVLIRAKNRTLAFWYPGDGYSLTRDLSAPRLSLTGSATVAFGEPTGFFVNYADVSDGTVTLSNGRQLTLRGTNGRAWVPVVVDRPTTFSIAAFESTCGHVPTYGERSVQLDVKPGIRVDSVSANRVCEGTPVTVYYSTTPGFSLPARMRFRTTATEWTEAVQTQPGQLTFVAPLRLPNSFNAGYTTMELRDLVSDNLIATAQLSLVVKGKSRAGLFQGDGPQTIAPGLVTLLFSYTSNQSDNVVVELNSGHRFTLSENFTNFPLYVSRSTTFSVVATHTECGTDSTRSVAAFIVDKPTESPTIVLQPGAITRPESKSYSPKVVCPGQAFWINPTVSGTFAADNQFQLEIADQNGNFTGPAYLTTTSPTAMSIAWPGSVKSLTVRLSATNPVVRSEPLTLQNYYNEPRIALRSDVITGISGGISEAGSATLVAGQSMQLMYELSGTAPYSFTYDSPQRLVTSQLNFLLFSYSNATLLLGWQVDANGVYGLRRATDGCGRLFPNPPVKQVAVASSTIVTGTPAISCAGLPIQIPFSVTGTVPPNTTFVVQASLDQENWQRLPTSRSGNLLSTQFPAIFDNKRAFYRVVGLLPTGDTLAGTTSAAWIQTPPSLRLSSPSGQAIVSLVGFDGVSLPVQAINLSNSSRNVLIRNQYTGQTVSIGESDQYYVTSPGIYTIVSASNQCGYGSGSGSVRVVRKPTLSQFVTNKTAYCTGETVAVTYVATDITSDNSLSLYLTDGRATKTLLTQTTVASGTYSFSLSPAMPPGSYSLVYESALPVEPLSQVATFTVQQPLSLTLGPARAVVYADAVPTLPLKVNTNAGPYSLTLSSPSGVSALVGTYASVLTLPRVETGTYTLLGAANQCGSGRVTGSASITVLPASAVRIEADPKAITALNLLCMGRTYTLPISASGTFGANNVFTAYLTDSTGVNRLTLPTISKGDVLTITVPVDAPVGDRYLLRIGSSDPVHLGASLRNAVQIRPTPTAVLTGNNTIMKGDSTRLLVTMTGAGPWQLTIADAQGPRSFIAAQSPYSLTVRPDTTTNYRITEVRNSQCGVGTASGTALIAVSRLLATEPLAVQVRVWPNPTVGSLQVAGELPADGPVQLSLRSLLGTLVQSVGVSSHQRQLQHTLDLSQLPSGLYILTAEQQGRRSQFKVVKQ